MAIDWHYHKHSGNDLDQLPLPQMQWAFDCDAVRRAVSMHVPDMPDTASTRIVDVYHRPAKSLDVCYAFGNSDIDHLVITLRFSPAERGGHAFRKAYKRATNPGHIFAIDNATFGWIFPEDNELPLLTKYLRSAEGCRPFRLLSYRRGARAALRQNIAGSTVVKIYDRAALHHGRLVDIFRDPTRQFGMAEPLSYSLDCSLRRESFLKGCAFEVQSVNIGPERTVVQMLRALTALHGMKIAALPELTTSTIMSRFHGMFLRRLTLSDLPSIRLCEDLGERLAATMPEQNVDPVALHGDLHIGNVLFADQDAVLIDLDETAIGDPAYDLAMFGSQLLLLDAISGGQNDVYRKLACDLPSMYEDMISKRMFQQSYAWYVAVLLASRHIKSCVAHAAPDLTAVSTRLARVSLEIAKQKKVTLSGLEA